MTTLITWQLLGTYLVHGELTGFSYETLPGVNVQVTNLSSNESKTIAADEDGSYAVDLGDTASFPSGYNIGDEISITATFRDATKTWKRRVQGSEIVQDVFFTFGTWQGALRKAKLAQRDSFTSPSSVALTIRDAYTRGILDVTKNGETLATSEWTFTRPNTVTLAEQPSGSDVFEVYRFTYFTEQEAKDLVVLEGDAQVRNAMARYYPSPLPTRVPELQDLSEALTGSAIRHRLYSGADKLDADAENLRRYAWSRIEELRKGARNLTDQDGGYLSPTAKTTTTPSSSTPTAVRQATRFTDSETKIQQF